MARKQLALCAAELCLGSQGHHRGLGEHLRSRPRAAVPRARRCATTCACLWHCGLESGMRVRTGLCSPPCMRQW